MTPTSAYDRAWRESIEDPASFWGRAAEDVHWFRRWDQVLDERHPPFYRWFPGGIVNSCYNALDVHVERGYGNQTALVYDSPVTDTIEHYSYGELLEKVSRFAGGLKELGVERGDRVVIYMPVGITVPIST